MYKYDSLDLCISTAVQTLISSTGLEMHNKIKKFANLFLKHVGNKFCAILDKENIKCCQKIKSCFLAISEEDVRLLSLKTLKHLSKRER